MPGSRIAYVLSAKGEDTMMSPWFTMESFTRWKKPRRKRIRIPQWNLQSLTLLMLRRNLSHFIKWVVEYFHVVRSLT